MDERQFITTDKNGKHIFKDAVKYSVGLQDLVRESLKSQGIVDTLSPDTNWHNKFARFGYIDPYNSLTGCREYIFFTRPDLNLLDDSGSKLATSSFDDPVTWDLENNAYLNDTYKRFPYLFEQWTCTKGPFMNMITNSVRSNLELPGASSKDIETSANIYGSKMTYRGTSWSSDEQFEFGLEFQDNKYLEMAHLFKIYDEYERIKAIGQVTPKSVYRRNRIIHDQFTAFKFVVGPDGRELIYWARATGCFPTSYPRDSFGNMIDMIGDSLKFNITFKAHFARDLSPDILIHFNKLSMSNMTAEAIAGKTEFTVKDDMPFYDPNFEGSYYSNNMNGDWAIRPLIVKSYNSTDLSSTTKPHKPAYKYHLIWLNY